MEDQENVPLPQSSQGEDFAIQTRDAHRAQSTHEGPRKPKKPPPVTPKRFSRFFTPRSSISRVSKASTSKAGRQLRDITQSGLNSRSGQPRRSRSPRKQVLFKDLDDLHNAAVTTTPHMPSSVTVTSSTKKRKAYPSPESQRFDSSPCKRVCEEEEKLAVDIPSSPPELLHIEDHADRERTPSPEIRFEPQRIRRAGMGNVSGRVLHRSFGGLDVTGRGRRRDNCTYWQADTSDYYTSPEDMHRFAHPALPYCSAACNTNSLVAVGDEPGTIRLVDTAKDNRHGFAGTHLSMQAHVNAVMDMEFSSDDSMLATAAGDQSSRIIDMHTQRIKFVMHAHTTSVKQIRFQPGNDNVLATSSRDGDIHIWDLRCKGTEIMVAEILRPRNLTPSNQLTSEYKAYSANPYGRISGAHWNRYLTAPDVPSAAGDSGSKDTSLFAAPTSRNGNVSVTALSFLNSPGRSHLLLSGSEASTTLHLWDIRNRYSRRGMTTPLSITDEPEAHSRHRHFGITSLVQNEQGSRIYALSRDNTLYAYSATHLINGHAPQLESGYAEKHQRSNVERRSGLGPIYGFRHPSLHITNFYIKAAIRKARDDKPEMLAIGSSDGCAVLFPTDEASFPRSPAPHMPSGLNTPILGPSSMGLSSPLTASGRPGLRRAPSSNFGLSTRMRDSIPIHNVGTALVGGHRREVTDVAWSYDGDLVTIGDDYMARVWRQDGAKAREARKAKYAGWGWAQADDGQDDEDWE